MFNLILIPASAGNCAATPTALWMVNRYPPFDWDELRLLAQHLDHEPLRRRPSNSQ